MKYSVIGDNSYWGDIKAQVFRNRGIEDVQAFENPSEAEVYSYKLLSNMDKGLKMFKKHFDSGNRIHIVAD